jgi:peptidoglycan-associated lipoprotein
MFSKSNIALSLLSASLFSCATEKPPRAPTPQASEARVAETAAAAVPTDFEDGTIKISKTIREVCGLNDDEAHFRFDSAVIQNADGGMLREVAACFIDGPLAGESMRLVGRADPRGEGEYNLLLGGRRGDNVKTNLVSKGMNPDQISASSRGEMDATGTDEASWMQDRRVDVMLASER